MFIYDNILVRSVVLIAVHGLIIKRKLINIAYGCEYLILCICGDWNLHKFCAVNRTFYASYKIVLEHKESSNRQ